MKPHGKWTEMLTEKNPRQTNGFPALPAPTHRAVPWPAAPGDATARRGLPSPVARLRQPARIVVRRKTRDEIAQSFKDACSSLEPRVVPGLERKTSGQTAEKQRAKRRELCVCVCVCVKGGCLSEGPMGRLLASRGPPAMGAGPLWPGCFLLLEKQAAFWLRL